MLKLKLQCFGHWWEELTHWKRPWCWERLRAGGEGATEDEMVGWHHRLDGHGFEQTPGVGDEQGGLACCDSWCCKESDTMEQLNWTELDCSMPGFPVFHCLLEFAQTYVHWVHWVSDAISVGKESACNVGDHPQCRRPGFDPWVGKIPASGRSPGEGNGNPLQYPCLGNLMDRGAWWAIVHSVTRVGHNLVTERKQHIVCVFILILHQLISLFLEPIFDNSSANLE